MTNWRRKGSEVLVTTPVFSIRRDRKHRGSEPDRFHDFFILDSVDWVNVVPVTEEGDVVFIELYRHGIDEVSLEIPGGMIDPGDETPMIAAARELEEETGYRSDSLVPLGVVHPNPAIQGNRCFSFLAEGATLARDPRPDETEDIRVVSHPRRDVPRLLEEGRITHALVVSALLWYFQREGLLR
jgi:8-oxo-dGTP pyrophosphatase MutT (NUDIX family)